MILQGTMQDGTVIPVQVDSQGRLVAEGLQGVQGVQGVRGNDGGSFLLPANPTDGKVLGWSSGGLAWVSPEWPQHPISSLPGTGYIPSTLGNPYWIDILPANANLYTTGTAASGFGALTDGTTETSTNRSAAGGTNLWTRVRLDLRSFADPQVELQIGCWWGHGSTAVGYSCTMAVLDSTRTRIGNGIVLSNGTGAPVHIQLPYAKNVRFVEFVVVAPGTANWPCRIHGITVNGGLINFPKFATAAASATPV